MYPAGPVAAAGPAVHTQLATCWLLLCLKATLWMIEMIFDFMIHFTPACMQHVAAGGSNLAAVREVVSSATPQELIRQLVRLAEVGDESAIGGGVWHATRARCDLTFGLGRSQRNQGFDYLRPFSEQDRR